ncbi:DUF1656 domain-containing protein [Methylosinus sp. H3A]|uniref:DUF1656 domain-containing protein n=1 Tax=Methylosinus sp. H3A TaxID=2785786 RepID=UPI0018C28650|nr:DUF1656 domain-containing protein [Methylosinus sp. H3A]MBG0808227.1 DUF1656 domain-containing protein [Methylosinus sp. H3A]
MNAEISIFGVFVSSLLASALVAFVLEIVIKQALEAVGFYRFVWHPALFNFAMFVCLLGACVLLSSVRSL